MMVSNQYGFFVGGGGGIFFVVFVNYAKGDEEWFVLGLQSC